MNSLFAKQNLSNLCGELPQKLGQTIMIVFLISKIEIISIIVFIRRMLGQDNVTMRCALKQRHEVIQNRPVIVAINLVVN